MKKTLLLLAATAATVLGAQAQDALRQTNFWLKLVNRP